MGGAALLIASCKAPVDDRTSPPADERAPADVRTSPPADGMYSNVTIEGRTVPMIHVKDNGATVLVDTVGTVPHVWTEQYRRQGDLPDGVLNIHKTHVEGHETFADIPIDRKGIWTIDRSGTLRAVAPTGLPRDGAYPNVTIEGRTVPMVHLKDNGRTLLVDTTGKVPRTWTEQYRRRGDVPEGMFDIHKTHVDGHENFRDLPVDRKGLWTLDASGNLTAR